MSRPHIWIIDEEWPDHGLEIEAISAAEPDAVVCESTYDWRQDFDSFGRDADAILAQVYAQIPADLISGLTRCKGIAVMGGGFDRIDMQAAGSARIPVCNVQGYCTEDIATYVIQAILHHLKPLDRLDATRHDLGWGLPALSTLSPRLTSSTLHIVGLGRIGSATARLALAMGMRVTATDARAAANAEAMAPGVEFTDLARGLSGADFISLHCPLTPDTVGLIGPRQIDSMKPSTVLINTARGDLVDERSLADALAANRLGGAVLDVVSDEPTHPDSPVFTSPNTLITPHISYASADSLTELRRRATKNLLDMVDGSIPDDCVNAGALARPAVTQPIGSPRTHISQSGAH